MFTGDKGLGVIGEAQEIFAGDFFWSWKRICKDAFWLVIFESLLCQ